ncbi:MAG TPA: hypothetical protein VMF09_07215 [Solirubrobacteraceae bacterium]|nr:hypothetical protein [Solirubrobacteraceae bacterium]
MSGALLAPISTANAGEWVQRTCHFNSEVLGTEGWEGTDNNGYTLAPREFCEEGGGFAVFAAPADDDEPYAGQLWTYKPPHGSTIAGGTLNASLTARNGRAYVEAPGSSPSVPLLVCEYGSCEHKEGKVTLPAGASQVTVAALCLPVEETGKPYVCHGPETEQNPDVFSAEAEVTDPEILLSTTATPKGSGFTGTLLRESVSGTATLDFTATDAGPGVYQVRVKIDGQQVLAETPNTNNGKCAVAGTSGSVPVFNYAQPCPTETAVRAEVPTASVTDGAHALDIEVEDAAGNVSTVYTGTVTTLNHAIATSVAPPERGPCNGNPCEETGKLTATAGEHRTFDRALKRSALTLTGRLTTPTGAPIKDAQVKLLQQIVGSATTTQTATATTTANGSWSLKAPAGPSRLLRVAFYSHTLDTVAAATLDFHENVSAIVSIHAPRHVRIGQFFTFEGQLTGGYIPPGGEEVQVQIRYGGRWRELQLVNANSKGKWKYRYAFTLEPGTKWAFRAIAVRNGSYPFTSHESPTIHVAVRR